MNAEKIRKISGEMVDDAIKTRDLMRAEYQLLSLQAQMVVEIAAQLAELNDLLYRISKEVISDGSIDVRGR